MPESLMPQALPDHALVAPHPPVAPPKMTDCVPNQANDNDPAAGGPVGERRTFELPAATWYGMIACYAVFLAALFGSTGAGRAGFAIAISALYVAMFFGTSRAIMRQAPRQAPSGLERPGASLQTAFGPMLRGAVFGQILIVPLAVALFGLSIALIISIVT